MKIPWKTYLGTLLSIGLLVLVGSQLSLKDCIAGFSRITPAWIAPMVGLFAIGLYLRAKRWQCLLAPAKVISLADSGNVILVGNFANNVLPAKAGDMARAVILQRRNGVRLLFGLTAVAVERIFDGLALLLLLVTSDLFITLAPTYLATMRHIAYGAGALFLGALAVLLGAKAFPALLRLGGILAGRLPGGLGTKASELVESLQESLFFIRPDSAFAAFALLSLGVWVVEGLTIWVGFQAFSIPGSIMDAYFTFAVTNFGGLLPSAPGNLGIYQASVVFAFSMLDLPLDTAVPLSIVVQSVQILFNSALGLYAMRRLQLGFSFFRSTAAR
ncbi:lysylphosphatidylglycerol synthase transmembrane domain-containing protein [Solidesulfovibrio sp. C21]|uniref:lysylphosphatidylglycerol synthase transmembrane domain-containing protein n=1 Tax=Solidesulfovibrio sp. C21 TaxID=3398613 RepID=UPI0039FC11C9